MPLLLSLLDKNIHNGKILMRILHYPLGQDSIGFMLNLCLLLGRSPVSDATDAFGILRGKFFHWLKSRTEPDNSCGTSN